MPFLVARVPYTGQPQWHLSYSNIYHIYHIYNILTSFTSLARLCGIVKTLGIARYILFAILNAATAEKQDMSLCRLRWIKFTLLTSLADTQNDAFISNQKMIFLRSIRPDRRRVRVVIEK
jgi:hypothetical protein